MFFQLFLKFNHKVLFFSKYFELVMYVKLSLCFLGLGSITSLALMYGLSTSGMVTLPFSS